MTDYEIEQVEVTARPTAIIATTTSWDAYPQTWPNLLDEVLAHVARPTGVRVGQATMLYLDDDPAVEVGIVLGEQEQIKTPSRVRGSELPAGRVARTVHRGEYERLDAAHHAIRQWCKNQGLILAGPRWEIYGDWRDDPAERITEVAYLLA